MHDVRTPGHLQQPGNRHPRVEEPADRIAAEPGGPVDMDTVDLFVLWEFWQRTTADNVDIVAPLVQLLGQTLDVAFHSAVLGQVVDGVIVDLHTRRSVSCVVQWRSGRRLCRQRRRSKPA